MHTPCVEIRASAGGELCALVSPELFLTSISTATTCSPLLSMVSEEGTMSTGSFSFFLFWIRFFFASRDKKNTNYRRQQQSYTDHLDVPATMLLNPQTSMTNVQM